MLKWIRRLLGKREHPLTPPKAPSLSLKPPSTWTSSPGSSRQELWEVMSEQEADAHLARHDPLLQEWGWLCNLISSLPAAEEEPVARRMMELGASCAPLIKRSMADAQPHITYHPGAIRLAINFEKAKRYADAIAVCEQAKREGFDDPDLDKRIHRCLKKLSKGAS